MKDNKKLSVKRPESKSLKTVNKIFNFVNNGTINISFHINLPKLKQELLTMIIQEPTLNEKLENLATVSVTAAVVVNVVKKFVKEVQKKKSCK